MGAVVNGGRAGPAVAAVQEDEHRFLGLSLLTVMKSLPLAYNKDLQEDKEGMFDTVETILNSLDVLAGMLSSMQINKTKMQQSTENDFSNATELAES